MGSKLPTVLRPHRLFKLGTQWQPDYHFKSRSTVENVNSSDAGRWSCPFVPTNHNSTLLNCNDRIDTTDTGKRSTRDHPRLNNKRPGSQFLTGWNGLLLFILAFKVKIPVDSLWTFEISEIKLMNLGKRVFQLYLYSEMLLVLLICNIIVYLPLVKRPLNLLSKLEEHCRYKFESSWREN